MASSLHFRLRFFTPHLLLSAAVVGTLAAIVIFVWYRPPLFSLQGTPAILLIVAFVDVIIGPLLTLIVASNKKSTRELVRDLALIGSVQVAALLYGAHSLFVARPAFVVFNADRFDAVIANELVRDTPFPYRDSRFAATPVLGPIWAMARPPDSIEERNALLFSTVQGGPDVKDIPALYVSWPPEGGVEARRLRPLSQLRDRSDEGKALVLRALQVSGVLESELAYVPLVGREKTGVVVLNRKTFAVVLQSDVSPDY